MMHDLCVLCASLFVGYGHNPAPLADKGRCCDACNIAVVMARLTAVENRREDE